MAKRHQGKQQPTYKSLKAQGKVMTPEGEIATLKKRVPGRGGGKQGVSGDLNVWGRFTGDSSDRTKNRKKVSAKKTAKRRGKSATSERKQVVDTDYLYGSWMKDKK
jgi:hypothetical protein